MPDPETQPTPPEWNSGSRPSSAAMDAYAPIKHDHVTTTASNAIPSPSEAYPYKLFDDTDETEPTKKLHHQKLADKLHVNNADEQSYLLDDINATIALHHDLIALFARVERDPHLFLITFLNANINGLLEVKTDASNTLVFSAINLIRNETVMRRALEPALTAELNGIRTPADLLRNNSHTTRLLTLCAKALGQNIVAGAVQPVMRKVLEGGVTFEIDPTIEENDSARKRNLTVLCEMAADLLKRVVSDIPSTLASVCRITYAAIEARFTGNGWIGISNLLFLRFVCSSVLAPAAGSSFSTAQKRNLVLLAKLVQSAASLRKFDDKESFMQSTNKFLATVIPQLKAFYKIFAVSEHSFDGKLPSAMRSYLVVRKMSSLTRIGEYLDGLLKYPNALALTKEAMSARIAYHHGFRRIIWSPLHDCIFIYEESKSLSQDVSPPLERYSIELIESPIVTVNGLLTLRVPEAVRLQFTDDDESNRWRHRIEAQIQKYKSDQ